MLHIALHGLIDNPCSANRCKERAWDRAERMEVAAIDYPTDDIYQADDGNSLYKRQSSEKHRWPLRCKKGVKEGL